MDMGLAGKGVVITGGSHGIGRAAARMFAEEGSRVVIASRTQQSLTKAAEEIKEATGAEVHPICCDITDPSSIDHLLKASDERLGGIDVVVSNAPGTVPKPYEEATRADWNQALGQKLLGYVDTAIKALPYLRKRGGGRIIIITGTGGREPNPWTTSTGVVNAGLANFTKTLASQLASQNILVNAVSPGPTNTARWGAVSVGQKDAASSLVSKIPLGRPAEPTEIAAAILFLASRHASYFVGSCLTVDGGRCASVDY